MKIMVSCAGTGGHVYPGIAVANELRYRHPDWEFLFVGCSGEFGIEKKLVPDNGYALDCINVDSFETFYSKWKKIKVAFSLFGSLNEALKEIRSFKPDMVLGMGGFVCGPVVLAARLKNIPTLIAEQNVIPGKTNKILSAFADKICISFEASMQYMIKPERCVLTGNPLRREFDMFSREGSRKMLELENDDKMVLVFGGSLGAQNLNKAVIKLISELMEDKTIRLFFITGNENYEACMSELSEKKFDLSKHSHINVMPYSDEMPKLMNAADLVICRSGATTIAEINYIGIPAIYVPLKHAANDHQRKNAMAGVVKKAALMVEDDENLADNLMKQVKYLLSNDSVRARMAANSKAMGKPNSVGIICDIIEETLK